MDKIAFVIPGYGNEIKDSTARLCAAFAEQLKELYRIDVLTTCAADSTTWENQYPPGLAHDQGICVRRFQVYRKKDPDTDSRLDTLLGSEHVYEDEIAWVQGLGPYCPELSEYVHGNYAIYRAIVFFTYQYYTTALCMPGVPNAILVPAVTEESVIALSHYQRVFREHKGFLFMSEQEKGLTEKLYGLGGLPYEICGAKANGWKLKALIRRMPKVQDHPVCLFPESCEVCHEVTPAFAQKNIAVVFAADDRYVEILSVALRSVLDHAGGDHNYDIVILSDGIRSGHRREILRMADGQANVSIRFLEAGYLLDQYPFQINNKRLSLATFLRLLLPDLMKAYDKILYLDGDTLLMRDPQQLYGIELGNCLVGAVKDPYIEVVRNHRTNVEKQNIKKYLRYHIGLEAEEGYFNAGVLLINLKAFRETYPVTSMLELAAKRKWLWEDQDVLNRLCRKRVYWLDANWNMIWCQNPYIQEIMMTGRAYFQAYHRPYIVHYAGGNIPVRYMGGAYSSEYWKTARDTPYYETLIFQMLTVFLPGILMREMKARFRQGQTITGRQCKSIWCRKWNSARIHLRNHGLRYTCKVFYYNLRGLRKYGIQNDKAMTAYVERKVNG